MPTAYGGGVLAGDRAVRFAYLDEAGIANPKHEPWVVIAGVIVHADREWAKVADYLSDLVREHVPPDKQLGYAFSAKELVHGGKVFTRQNSTRESRWAILKTLCAVPKKFHLPVAAGYADRISPPPGPLPPRIRNNTVLAVAAAAVMCVIDIEKYMRQQGEPGELATLIYENNDEARSLVRFVQNAMRRNTPDPNNPDEVFLRNFLPLRRIVEPPLFAEKHESSILQVADACAYALKRRVMQKPDADELCEDIEPLLIPHLSSPDESVP